MKNELRVSGEVVLPADAKPGVAADVTVIVEDISRADAPARVVGETHKSKVALKPGGVVPFDITIPAGQIDQRALYSVRAHVDMTGKGEVTRGDLVSVQTYPVLTRGHGSRAHVEVRRV